ncbi:MAG: UvrD-helicase domain-containing protein [bacterium]|nr:MAG: UvrD-helicase domain-containing protein [bacterium]
MTRNFIPPDQDQRDRVVADLGSSMLVEAAAGTGKTTVMVARMIALLREGRCTPSTIAAMTFTRKAAAELKGRFAADLAVAAREAAGGEAERLSEALADLDQVFVGTIHSFCSRLLRERPVEAGVDPGFGELAEDADVRYRKEAWARYLEQAGPDDPVLKELAASGLTPTDLAASFVDYCRYPDLDRWPADRTGPPDLSQARKALADYLRHLDRLLPDLPRDPGNDGLIPRLRRIRRMSRRLPEGPASLFAILSEIKPEPGIIQKVWPGKKEQALAEKERHTRLAEDHAVPAVNRWLAYRYGLVMEAFAAAAGIYEDIRAESGSMNFQDLLMAAAGLLRDKPAVREYFRARFTHLLVDEFQDTDPVQAQVMLLLTADDVNETDWTRCRPVPGSLFVVGDPKQSIYRFRRADIVVYETVKEILCGPDNPPVHLSTSFRSTPELIRWVNDRFSGPFGELTRPYSPGYVPLQPGPETDTADLTGIERSDNLRHLSNRELIHAFEPGLIARDVRARLTGGQTVPRKEGPSPCCPGDFMVVTAYTHQLGLYGAALQEMGIPHQVTGGSGLSTPPELGMLAACFKAVLFPEDPVALLAVLRGGLFGLTDQQLYDYALAGGTFNYREGVPEVLGEGTGGIYREIFDLLTGFRERLGAMPPVAVLSAMTEELGLAASAAAGENGDLMAGSLLKALELLRGDLRDRWSPEDLLDYLHQLASGEEKHDGITAVSPAEEPVRVMNLHKVKGLEAPVVYLADPTGQSDREPLIHIDRSHGNRSSDEIAGYMKVLGPTRGFMPGEVLARPLDWEHLAAEEKRFADAEELRRLYVAATRAGSRLVVSQRAKGERSNPWLFFKEGLEEAAPLEDPGKEVTAHSKKTGPAIAAAEAEKARETIAASWQRTMEQSYDKGFPSQYGAEGKADRRRPVDEEAAKRGTVIHGLLEAAMTRPEVDLEELSRSLCANQDLDVERAAEFVRTAREAAQSSEWARARRAERIFTEIPYTRLLEGREIETVETGVMDLVFEEDGGWVIVDYKTGAQDLERYRFQLEAYQEAWESFGAGEVKEVGILWVDSGNYEVL